MGVTNFPNGVNVGDAAGVAAELQIGGTVITPLEYTSAGKVLAAGTVIVTGSTAIVPSGISAALFVVASPYGVAPTGAGTVGGFAKVSAGLSGGTVTIYAQDVQGTASLTAGTASYVVIGT